MIVEGSIDWPPYALPPRSIYNILPISFLEEVSAASMNCRWGDAQTEYYNGETRRLLLEGDKDGDLWYAEFEQDKERFQKNLKELGIPSLQDVCIKKTIKEIEFFFDFPNDYFTSKNAIEFRRYTNSPVNYVKLQDLFNYLIAGKTIDYTQYVFEWIEHLKIIHIENIVKFYRFVTLLDTTKIKPLDAPPIGEEGIQDILTPTGMLYFKEVVIELEIVDRQGVYILTPRKRGKLFAVIIALKQMPGSLKVEAITEERLSAAVSKYFAIPNTQIKKNGKAYIEALDAAIRFFKRRRI